MHRQRFTFGQSWRLATRHYDGAESDATGCLGFIAIAFHGTWWWIVGAPVRDDHDRD